MSQKKTSSSPQARSSDEARELCDPETLTDMARRGESEALERASRCYRNYLLAVGRRSCRGSDDAEDAVQDAMLSATEHLDTFRGEGALSAWLTRIVVRACQQRRRGRKNDPSLHDRDQESATTWPDPEELALRAELARKSAELLAELSPSDQSLFVMASIEELSAPRIAEALGSSPGAIRVRLSRIRKRLREKLSPDLAANLIEENL